MKKLHPIQEFDTLKQNPYLATEYADVLFKILESARDKNGTCYFEKREDWIMFWIYSIIIVQSFNHKLLMITPWCKLYQIIHDS